MHFPSPQLETASALHAVGVPVGKPSKDSPFAGLGYFTPHVVIRNLLSTPQTAVVTVEYPSAPGWDSHAKRKRPDDQSDSSEAAASSPGDFTGQLTLGPLTVGGYSTQDVSLDSILGRLPQPLPYVSIRIQHSGAPGSMVAEVSSVEQQKDLVVDAKVQNEGNGWAGSGGNPWHLDKDTESYEFLTNMGDEAVRIGFKVWADGQIFYLGSLELVPHETRMIDLRKLRDAQETDLEKHQVPAGATDGSVLWLRLDNVPVMGRLAVITRHGGMASSYDCCLCGCPGQYAYTLLIPVITCPITVAVGDQVHGQVWYSPTCGGTYYYFDMTTSLGWSSTDTSVFTLNNSNPKGLLTGIGGGAATALAQGTTACQAWYMMGAVCQCSSWVTIVGNTPCPVDNATMSSPVQTIDGSTTPSFNVTTTGPDTPTSYAWSFTAPSGAGDNPNVNFNHNNQASTTTNAHWFALPDNTCNASTSAVYTIIATVSFPGNLKIAPQTTLTVSLLATAGVEPKPYVLGYPATGQNANSVWVVTGPGTLSRSVQSPIIYYASSSQFYNKVLAHENEHVKQWTSGMNSDLYLVSSLMAALSPLTSTTQDGLKAEISNTWNQSWMPSQDSVYQSRLPAAEADAYQVSDPIPPQYYYQSTCGARGM